MPEQGQADRAGWTQHFLLSAMPGFLGRTQIRGFENFCLFCCLDPMENPFDGKWWCL
jgi:hypothetical protein